MSKRANPKNIPTADEIMQYRNVPVDAAAAYLGLNPATLRRHLQDQRVPFGYSWQGGEKWNYHISPGALVRYQAGELSVCRFKELAEDIAESVLMIVRGKLSGVNKLLTALDEVA